MLREVSWFCSFGGVRALVGLLFVTPHAPPSVFLGGFSHTFVKSILLEHFSFLPSARTHFYSFLLTLSFFFDIEGINLHSKILCNEYTKIDSKPNFFTCIHRISISRGTNFPDRFWNYQQVHTVSVQMGGNPGMEIPFFSTQVKKSNESVVLHSSALFLLLSVRGSWKSRTVYSHRRARGEK